MAERLVKGARELGGQLTEDDLADYDAQWCEPIGIKYRDYETFTVPPNSTGFQILETMKMMEGLVGVTPVFQDPETLHIFTECVKLAVADRIKWGGDPDYVTAPLEGLLSDGYAERQRARIDQSSASLIAGEQFTRIEPSGSIKAGSPEAFDGGMTTHFAVADSDGNVVSVTQTLGGAFGSAVAPGDTGLFPQQHGLLVRPRTGSAQSTPGREARRLLSRPDPDVPGRQAPPEPRYARQLGESSRRRRKCL